MSSTPHFAHLHVHTEYSFLDGVCKVRPLLEQTRELGMTHLAITDHGTMHGTIDFYRQAKQMGITPIIGCEVYVAPRGHRVKGVNSSGTDGGSTSQQSNYYHLILLAENETGYRNLIRLCTSAHLDGFYYKPRVDDELLRQHHEGLIALSACLAGEAATQILSGQIERAARSIEKYHEIFGPDHFFLEIQSNGLADQDKANEALKLLSSQTGVPLVATNDIHYIKREDAELQSVLLALQQRKTLEDSTFSFEGQEFYLKSPEEMVEAFKDCPEAVENAWQIAQRCQVEIELDPKHMFMPAFDLPDGFNGSESDYMRYLVYQGAQQRYGQVGGPLQFELAPPADWEQQIERMRAGLVQPVWERIDFELDVIDTMKYVGYFLIVWDFIRFARENGISVGPGRGSAAGAIVAFCLGITDIEPLRFGLIFERFLNPERISPPDIDTDFSDKRRSEVIEYCARKYGSNQVCQIATFSRLKAKAALKDVGRVLGIPPTECNELTRLIPDKPDQPANYAGSDADWKALSDLEKAVLAEPRLQAVREQDSRHRKLFDYAIKLENHVRQTGIHAAGVVIAPQDMNNWCPLMSTREEGICSQFEAPDLEQLGLMKMDFLGLRTLSVMEDTIRRLAQRAITVELENIPQDDSKTFDLLCEGRTNGVFQLESPGMKNLLKQLLPRQYEDMTPLVALYRPGPLGSGMVRTFVECRHDRQYPTYDHPSIEPILKETFGVILYQEQVMRIAQVYAGFTMGAADLMRRAMGKKKKEVMDKQREKFVEGAIATTGVKAAEANALFDKIAQFAGYGFNKSHSAAYGVVAYQTAYLKANFTPEYLASMITNEMGNSDKVVAYLKECSDLGINVLPPDINESEVEFSVTAEGIRFGLGAVHGLGSNMFESLLAERARGGAFSSLEDFCERVDLRIFNQSKVEILIRCGALDSFGLRRSQLLALLPDVMEHAGSIQRDRNLGQSSLFALLGDDAQQSAPQSFPVPEIPELTEQERLAEEKRLLGFYVSGHPLNQHRQALSALTTESIESLAARIEEAQQLSESRRPQLPVRIAGMVSKVAIRKNAEGESLASFLFEDFSGIAEAIMWPSVYSKYGYLLSDEKVLVLEALAGPGRDKPVNLRVDVASDIEQAFEKSIQHIQIDLRGLENQAQTLHTLQQLVNRNTGRSVMLLSVQSSEKRDVVIEAGEGYRVAANREFVHRLGEILDRDRVRYLATEFKPPPEPAWRSGGNNWQRGGNGQSH